MNTENKPNFYAIIPAEVRYDKDLSPNAKLLYGEITALCNAEGYCWANNTYFSDLYDVTKRSVQLWISQLEDKGFIRVVIDTKGSNNTTRRIYPGSKHDFTREKNFTTPMKKITRGDEKNFTTPHEKNFTHNNTSINTTNNNTVNKKKKTPSTDKSAQSSFEAEFDQFWKLYPRKTKKQNARESFIKARKKNKIPYEIIEEGLYKYVRQLEHQETDIQFITHASTWLNQARWEDEYISITPKKKKISNFMDLLDEFGGESENEHERNTQIIDHDTSYIPYA